MLRRPAGPALGVVALFALALLPIAPATAVPLSPAAGHIRNAGAASALKDSYLVVLKENAGLRALDVPAVAKDLAVRHGGTVRHTYRSALRGFAVHMRAADAERLATDPAVAYVEQDRRVRATDVQPDPPSWGLDRIDQTARPLTGSYTTATQASNVTAYIIDTGINAAHSDFGGRATSGYDFVDNDADSTDCNGHGTHVAGTVGGTRYGVAKGVKLVGVRVLGCTGSGSITGVIAGVDWVTAHHQGPSVANMSLGGGLSTALDTAVRNSVASGVTYALAAGNDAADACDSSPGRVAEALTVGATDRWDVRADFSNYGSCVDLFAPGVDITSAWYDSATASRTISGTSMATPHVAAAAALYLAGHPDAAPDQVSAGLLDAATPDVVEDPQGSPDRLLFTTQGERPGPFFEATADVPIPDAGDAVESPLDVKNMDAGALADLAVQVKIVHPYPGDLRIDLVAPDGAVIALQAPDPWAYTPDLVKTFHTDASGHPANGTWKLRVQDVSAYDSGLIDRWNLEF
ncbi:S8 family peptidase [Streptomyces sp. NBC_01465]|uniref:S8 family peptidase n=1 Tax=Streptomyces sp. NBC_01465 TaxID=2903878 RepID=UPI002E374FA9|nr:S8 family serine peptidase [Streptomyces sp. NBC_01465]